MTFEGKDTRSGKTFIVCSKRWPDKTRFRRRYDNITLAKKVLARIENSIAIGTWRELKKELTEGPEKEFTIKEFSKVYLEEYCRIRNSRPDFKEETLEVIERIVGARSLKRFTSKDAHYFERERSKEVGPSTVNRGLAVLSNMFTFAIQQGLIPVNPMAGYGRIKVDQKTLQILTAGEERLLVAKTIEVDPVVGAYVGILGETGLRMSEGLELKWADVNLQRRQLTVAKSKSRKARYVPISEYAAQLLGGLTRIIANPYVFVRLSTMDRLRAPRKEFEEGKRLAGIVGIGLHGLRHYRGTQWLRHGVDIRTVKEWLGHRSIETTMRYLHFTEGHAQKRFTEAQNAELIEIAQAETPRATNGTQN